MFKYSYRLLIATLFFLLVACTDHSHTGGYRHSNEPSRLLRLSEDGSFAANSGDVGSYKVEGDRITFLDPAFGSAEGIISGNTITIQGNPNSDTAKNLAGNWKKIGKGS
jgi:hypothetical protein